MNLLITSAATPLGQALAAGLKEDHHLRLTDKDPLNTELEFIQHQLGHDESTDALVQDIDTIVHLTYAPRDNDSPTEWLDINTRRHYNLLLAASTADVKTVLLLSTLDLFLPYDEDMTVSEHWQPLPSTEPALLGAQVAEFTAREFAHSHALDVVIMRLGHVARAQDAVGQTYDPMWLDERDAIQAVNTTLQKRADLDRRRRRNYHVLHLQSVSSSARFSSERLCKGLDFTPQYNFETHV